MRPLVLVLVFVLVGCARSEGSGLRSTSSQACASCHVEQASDFALSRHAHATESAVFQALLPHVAESWGEAARARCVSCHQPPHGDDQAIGCVSCHAAVGDRGARDGRLVLDLDAPMMTANANVDAPHPTRTSGLLRSSELCASCHEVTGPDLFVEHTGTENAMAIAATGAPECAGCHVPAHESGAHDHRFAGLDAASLDTALELRFVAGALELENVGAAHSVPTGVAFFRDVWVDLEVTHADGTHETLPRVIELGDRPMRGAEPVALPTDADRVEENRLAPFEIRRVALDPSVVSATATLHARSYRASVLTALALDPAQSVVLDVATARF